MVPDPDLVVYPGAEVVELGYATAGDGGVVGTGGFGERTFGTLTVVEG